jgi:hypothetical protein
MPHKNTYKILLNFYYARFSQPAQCFYGALSHLGVKKKI